MAHGGGEEFLFFVKKRNDGLKLKSQDSCILSFFCPTCPDRATAATHNAAQSIPISSHICFWAESDVHKKCKKLSKSNQTR
jgi:hypothetical protein